ADELEVGHTLWGGRTVGLEKVEGHVFSSSWRGAHGLGCGRKAQKRRLRHERRACARLAPFLALIGPHLVIRYFGRTPNHPATASGWWGGCSEPAPDAGFFYQWITQT